MLNKEANNTKENVTDTIKYKKNFRLFSFDKEGNLLEVEYKSNKQINSSLPSVSTEIQYRKQEETAQKLYQIVEESDDELLDYAPDGIREYTSQVQSLASSSSEISLIKEEQSVKIKVEKIQAEEQSSYTSEL